MASSIGKIAIRDRVQWQEIYQFSPKHFLGDHDLKVGVDFSHSSYDGRQQFLPVEIVGTGRFDTSSELNSARRPLLSSTRTSSRGLAEINGRLGRDSPSISACVLITTPLPIRPTPRPACRLDDGVDKDRKTLLKAGGGLFYDRVPLNARAFPTVP